MKNALDVLAEMNRWWHIVQPLDQVARTPENAAKHGMTWLHNQSYNDYENLKVESSKQAHFRQLFTVWKAVCARLHSYPFNYPAEQAMLLFPAFIERNMPQEFVHLVDRNIFLGVKFSAEDKARHAKLRQQFMRQVPVPAKRTSTPYASTYNQS